MKATHTLRATASKQDVDKSKTINNPPLAHTLRGRHTLNRSHFWVVAREQHWSKWRGWLSTSNETANSSRQISSPIDNRRDFLSNGLMNRRPSSAESFGFEPVRLESIHWPAICLRWMQLLCRRLRGLRDQTRAFHYFCSKNVVASFAHATRHEDVSATRCGSTCHPKIR